MQTTSIHSAHAAPPDDGGGLGAHSVPQDALSYGPDDTRASEMLGVSQIRDHNVNRGLWLFWATVASGMGLIVLFGAVHGSL
jgi:hypothetical protein